MNRSERARLAATIEAYGFQITSVGPSTNPKYSYTIGLSKKTGFELVLAGAAILTLDDVVTILNRVGNELFVGGEFRPSGSVIGLEVVDRSWTELVMIGAIDYFDGPVAARSIKLDPALQTIDIPDMSVPFSGQAEPVWRFLNEEWPYQIARETIVMTNLDALKGDLIDRVSHWEDDEWELMANHPDDVELGDARAVPFATLLGSDPTLRSVLALPKGKSLKRQSVATPWENWGS